MTFVPPDVVSEVEALPPRACPYCAAGAGLCALHALADRGCFTCGGAIEAVLSQLGSLDCHDCRQQTPINVPHP